MMSEGPMIPYHSHVAGFRSKAVLPRHYRTRDRYFDCELLEAGTADSPSISFPHSWQP